jgi:hypothetical protein
MNRIEASTERAAEVERIALHEMERIARLWFDVHTHDLIEPSATVANRRAAGTAE